MGHVTAQYHGDRRRVQKSTAVRFALVDKPAYPDSLLKLNRWEDWEGYQGERRKSRNPVTPLFLADVAMVEIASDIRGLKDLAKNSDKLKKELCQHHPADCPAERGPAGAQQGPGEGTS